MKGLTGNGPIAVVGTLLLILGALLGSAVAQAADPGISLVPTSGVVSTPITVSGTEFPTGSTFTLTYAGQFVLTGTTSSTGTLTAGFNAPAASFGPVTVKADSGALSATAIFTLAGITLAPTSGVVTTPINVTGNGFLTDTAFTVTYGSQIVLTGTTTATGTLVGVFNAPAAPLGPVTVSATDSALTATATFSVTSSATIAPTSGVVETPVNVSGAGYPAATLFTVQFGGLIVLTGTTTASGSISGSFKAPLAAFTSTPAAGGGQTRVGRAGAIHASGRRDDLRAMMSGGRQHHWPPDLFSSMN